jgi:hypothetical protein
LRHRHVINGEVSELVVATGASATGGLSHTKIDFNRIIHICGWKRYRYPSPKITQIDVSACKYGCPRSGAGSSVRPNQYLKIT